MVLTNNIVQSVKNLPAMQETRAQFLGQEDPLEKEMATHSSILAWRIPWTEEPQFMSVQLSGLSVHHQLLEFTQTHVHPVSDAIQPSHPQSSPSPPAPNPSQHQSLFQ